MSRKRQRRRRLIIFLTVIFLIVCTILYFLIFKFGNTPHRVLDKIDGYNYNLEKRDTELMKKEFQLLKQELKKKNINYEEYAKLITKLYIIDLYTINNKRSKYDVGGSEYIYPDHKDNYEIKVQDTLYKYVEEKSTRKQKLPEVSEVSIKDISDSKYKYNDNEYDAYELNVSWDYKKDLGYDDNAKVTVVKIDDKLFIASLDTKEAS